MPTILHVSDIHFGPPHRRRASDGLVKLVAERDPSLVVVAGDITQRAKPVQFRQAREWVDRLSRPSIVVPGNHDVPMYRVWERVLSPFGAYRSNFSSELEPVHQGDGLFVIGINSAYNWTIKDGRVSGRRIREVEEAFRMAPEGAVKVAVVHHELIPAPRFGSQKILANGKHLAAVLAESGVELVLSGHLHQAYCSKLEAYHPGVGGHTVVVHSGTSSSTRGRGCEKGRSTAFWVELDSAEVRLTCIEWESNEGAWLPSHSYAFPRAGIST